MFASGQDLKELIAGPGGAHFTHVLKKYPDVELRIDGQCSTAAPPAHRIHVSMSSEDSELFESAAADVLDLVETVCDMVGEELGMSEDQVEGLIGEIRAEKYFEAHGIRTPLVPARSATKPDPPSTTPVAPAPLPGPTTPSAYFPNQQAGLLPPTDQFFYTAPQQYSAAMASSMPVSQMGHPMHSTMPGSLSAFVKPEITSKDSADFEFIDEDIDMVEPAGGGADTDDDARTEASDMLSDITGPDEDKEQMNFDDI